MYANIIFVQDGETLDKVQEIFAEEGYIAAIEYLSQWDYGYESEHMFSLVNKINRRPYEVHYHYNMGGDQYTLVEHPLYMSLYRVVYSGE